MIPAMSPRTRRSFTTIGPALDSWVTPKRTLGSPLLGHLHHHHNSPRRHLPPVPHSTSKTRCSPLLSALMHSRTRPRSTESSSHRIWRCFASICVRCWPTRPLFFSSNSRSRPSWPSSYPTTSRRHRHRSDLPDHQGSSLHPLLFFLASGDTGYFCLGGYEW